MCEHSEYFGEKYCEGVVPAVIENPQKTLSTYREQGLLATLHTVPNFDKLFANAAVCEELIRQVRIAQCTASLTSLADLLTKAEAGSVKAPTLWSQPTRSGLVSQPDAADHEAVRASLASVRPVVVERQLASVRG